MMTLKRRLAHVDIGSIVLTLLVLGYITFAVVVAFTEGRSKEREHERHVVSGDLKLLVTGMEMYAQDYGGRLPDMSSFASAERAIYPYTKFKATYFSGKAIPLRFNPAVSGQKLDSLMSRRGVLLVSAPVNGIWLGAFTRAEPSDPYQVGVREMPAPLK